MRLKNNYTHTLCASYVGYITQAIVNNFAPLLFLTFQKEYHIPLDQITLLVTVNFGIQLLIDLASAKFVDRIGYRVSAVAAHLFAAAGLVGLGFFPALLPHPFAGLLLAIVLYAVGGGLLEVLVSPIVEACPTKGKSAAMSLLHSFYCWGYMFVVIVSTIFFTLCGIGNWRYLSLIWAIVPIANAVYFTQVPIAPLTKEGESLPIHTLLHSGMFWIFALLMVCSGASEQAMNQWVSSFAEAGLHVSKTAGDLAGPCLFAALMGVSRVAYTKFSGRVRLKTFMLTSGIVCIASYLLAVFSPVPVLGFAGCGLCGLSVGIMWPGTFSMASASFPKGGTALFALLALGGDLGCSAGPTLVGMVSYAAGGAIRSGLLTAVIFPVMLVAGLCLLRRPASARQKATL